MLLTLWNEGIDGLFVAHNSIPIPDLFLRNALVVVLLVFFHALGMNARRLRFKSLPFKIGEAVYRYLVAGQKEAADK